MPAGGRQCGYFFFLPPAFLVDFFAVFFLAAILDGSFSCERPLGSGLPRDAWRGMPHHIRVTRRSEPSRSHARAGFPDISMRSCAPIRQILPTWGMFRQGELENFNQSFAARQRESREASRGARSSAWRSAARRGIIVRQKKPRRNQPRMTLTTRIRNKESATVRVICGSMFRPIFCDLRPSRPCLPCFPCPDMPRRS